MSKRVRRLDSGMEVPLQVQLIEAEFLPMFDADTWVVMPDGNKIRLGIKPDNWGQRVAYWMYRDTPGDDTMVDMSKLLRVPASEVKHVYEVKRPCQLRGVSAMARCWSDCAQLATMTTRCREPQKLVEQRDDGVPLALLGKSPELVYHHAQRPVEHLEHVPLKIS